MMVKARLAVRLGAAASLAALLAGCSGAPVDSRAAYEALEEGTGDARSAMAMLPSAAGTPVAVLQTQTHTTLTQRIVLRGEPTTVGENSITVRVNIDKGPTDLDGPIGIPTRGRILAELEENFAGVDMDISQTFARNSFGPFGYAVGHPRTNETCLFAWQFAIWKAGLLGAGPDSAASLPTQPTSVRVRLCRTGLGEAEMVQWLKDLQVYPPHSRLAYSDPAYTTPATGSDALGAAGVGSFTATDAKAAPASPEKMKPHRRRADRHHHRHARHASREQRAVAEDPPMAAPALQPGGFMLPVPPAASSAAASSSSNPLLAPLSAPTAKVEDLPLPRRQSAAPAPAAPTAPRSSIPLPD